MFRKKVQYVLEWAVPAKTWPELRPEFNEFAGRSLRAAGFGFTLAAVNYALIKLILPELKPPPLDALLLFAGSIVGIGGFLALTARFSSEKRKYGLSNEAVHLIPTEFLGTPAIMPFKICQAWVLHDSSNRMEMFTRAGDIFIFDLPRDAASREQVVAFVLARVKPWLHLKAPSEIRISTGSLEGISVPLFWVLTLLGSIVLASSVEAAKFFKSEFSGYYILFFGQWLVGTGYIWGWNTWKKLALFPIRKRLNLAFHSSVFGNLFFNILLMQFVLVFDTSRIRP